LHFSVGLQAGQVADRLSDATVPIVTSQTQPIVNSFRDVPLIDRPADRSRYLLTTGLIDRHAHTVDRKPDYRRSLAIARDAPKTQIPIVNPH